MSVGLETVKIESTKRVTDWRLYFRSLAISGVVILGTYYAREWLWRVFPSHKEVVDVYVIAAFSVLLGGYGIFPMLIACGAVKRRQNGQ